MIKTSSVEKATFQFRLLSDDQIEEIKWAAFDVMRTVGFKVFHNEARKILKQAGAIVREEIVKVPEHIVRECLRLAPKGWIVFNRNGKRAMEVQGRKSYFGTSTASPNNHDIMTGKVRPTRLEDIARGARLADALEHIDFVMPFGSSQDVPGEACDINEFPAIVANTVKPIVFIGYSGRQPIPPFYAHMPKSPGRWDCPPGGLRERQMPKLSMPRQAPKPHFIFWLRPWRV